MPTEPITQLVKLVQSSEVAPATVKRCLADGYPAFAVYNLDGEFFVTEDTCTHGMASLSEGTLDGDVIECPYHGGAFHVRTGEPAERPCVIALKTFKASVIDGIVNIEAPPPRQK
jgi:nitrite reductase/ring-hydroxylating ferredoxin subunit